MAGGIIIRRPVRNTRRCFPRLRRFVIGGFLSPWGLGLSSRLLESGLGLRRRPLPLGCCFGDFLDRDLEESIFFLVRLQATVGYNVGGGDGLLVVGGSVVGMTAMGEGVVRGVGRGDGLLLLGCGVCKFCILLGAREMGSITGACEGDWVGGMVGSSVTILCTGGGVRSDSVGGDVGTAVDWMGEVVVGNAVVGVENVGSVVEGCAVVGAELATTTVGDCVAGSGVMGAMVVGGMLVGVAVTTATGVFVDWDGEAVVGDAVMAVVDGLPVVGPGSGDFVGNAVKGELVVGGMRGDCVGVLVGAGVGRTAGQ
mmetsp:Transcript_32457/g.67685  ORF Transcript_32457/g.67685 Transcript_32457/m.67685 type:complete len:311 (-) Transcript_32457:725-1657(-)